jgi:hypothetical protein
VNDPAAPGNRIALHDRMGSGYTLLRLGGTRVDTSNLERPLRASSAPFDVFKIDDEAAREIYGYDLLLVRPDLHVVWRGNRIPEGGGAIASVATGRVAARVPSTN